MDIKCVQCSKTALFLCSSCGQEGATFYCSAECQSLHWPEHRPLCSQPISIENIVNNRDSTNSKKKVNGRFAAAQNINLKHNKKTTTSHNNLTDQPIPSSLQQQIVDAQFEEEPLTEDEKAEDLKFYMQQVYLIIKPVLACIFLSIFWVKMTIPAPEYYEFRAAFVPPSGDSGTGVIPIGGNTGAIPSSEDIGASLKSAGIYMAQIIGATFVLLLLFKYGFMKVLYTILGVMVMLLLGLFGYVLSIELLVAFNIPFDWISFIFLMWNLVTVGMIQVFWKGPMILNQSYLVLMSSLMAFALTQTAALTTWILLSLLVVWDLVAVLCPFGPLKLLVENSRETDREIPALLYSVMIWFMASEPKPNKKQILPSPTTQDHVDEDDVHSPEATGSIAPLTGGGHHSDGVYSHGENFQADPAVVVQNEEIEEDDERSGLKLGYFQFLLIFNYPHSPSLGDFVFYSVLVARGALFDWTTTISCTVAVMTGLNMTIFLLAIYQKALPALPISITFGILFYFVSSIMLTPFINSLIVLPGFGDVTSGLQIGVDGGGFVFV